MQMVSGPRVVSPPISSQSCASASASRPRAKPARKASSARGSASASVKASGLAPQAARSLQVDRQRLVAEALGRDGGQEVPALDQHVARDGELHARAAASSAQSSPTPSAARAAPAA